MDSKVARDNMSAGDIGDIGDIPKTNTGETCIRSALEKSITSVFTSQTWDASGNLNSKPQREKKSSPVSFHLQELISERIPPRRYKGLKTFFIVIYLNSERD